jgi:lysophospholipase L1-like esterase
MREVRIVALGDSITKASNLPDERSYRKLVERELRERTGREIRVINAGVNSDITTLALERIERDVLSHQPHIVTVMFGVNDAGFFRPDGPPADTPRVAEDEFRENLLQIVRRIRESGAIPVLVTHLPMSPSYPLADLPAYVENGLNYLVDRYAEIVRQVASEMVVSLIDTHRYFSDHPETQEYLPDGIHPNEKGHEVIASLFVPVLIDLIARMG